MPIRSLLLIGPFVVLCACGKSSSPVTPSPALNGLSITPATDLITIKGTETFASTAAYSNGSSGVVQSTWSSDAPAVATIESTTGRAIGVGAGQATISAQYQTQHATRLLRVVPDYSGRWQGDWVITACASDGDWQQMRACETVYTTGSLWALTLVANQTRDSVSGTVDFGDNMPGPVTGTIGLDGHLSVSGTYAIVLEGMSVEVTVSNWDTMSSDNQQMTGRFRLAMRVAGLQGSVSTDGDLRVVGKSAAPSATAMGVAHALSRRAKHR